MGLRKLKIRTAALICALSLISASVPMGAGAAEWINLSSWAYEEVSGFVSDGLLAGRLKGEADYTRAITRGEFAELIYSVLSASGRGGVSESGGSASGFADCSGYPDINKLDRAIFEGLEDAGVNLYPERRVTREEAALIIYNALGAIGVYGYSSIPDYERLGANISDAGEISGYAVNAVEKLTSSGIMTDTGGGKFEPKSEITIEQGIAVLYRIYRSIPKLIYADAEGIEGGSGEIQSYGGGLAEIYSGGRYTVTDNGAELLSFEADVYSKLLCCEYGGRRLAFAVNFNDKTDVYDLDSGKVIYSIPYIVYRLDAENGLVYVYSSRFMPACSGLYSMDGAELTPPEYSESELSELAANGFDIPEEERRNADGWVYYTDRGDGRIYKTDSNGENESLLTADGGCTNIAYADGMVFYNSSGGSLMCTDGSGGGAVLSEQPAELLTAYDVVFDPHKPPQYAAEKVYSKSDDGGNRITDGYFLDKNEISSCLRADGSIIFGEAAELKRTIVDLEEKSTGERTLYACRLYKVNISENGAEAERVADFPAIGICASPDGSGIYFMNAEELVKNGDSPIYAYDGKTVSALPQGLRAECFGFLRGNGDEDGMIGYLTKDEIGGGTYHVFDPSDGSVTVKDMPEYEKSESGDSLPLSDDENGRLSADWDGSRLKIEYGGSTKELENVLYIDTFGGRVYYSPGTARSFFDMSVLSTVGMGRVWRISCYDYRTGGTAEVSDDFSESFITSRLLGDKQIYKTAAGQYRLLTGTESVSVYPNKGLHRFGELSAVARLDGTSWQNGRLYKIDKDGNFTQLTERGAEEWIYVPNGGSEAKFSG